MLNLSPVALFHFVEHIPGVQTANGSENFKECSNLLPCNSEQGLFLSPHFECFQRWQCLPKKVCSHIVVVVFGCRSWAEVTATVLFSALHKGSLLEVWSMDTKIRFRRFSLVWDTHLYFFLMGQAYYIIPYLLYCKHPLFFTIAVPKVRRMLRPPHPCASFFHSNISMRRAQRL